MHLTGFKQIYTAICLTDGMHLIIMCTYIECTALLFIVNLTNNKIFEVLEFLKTLDRILSIVASYVCTCCRSLKEN